MINSKHLKVATLLLFIISSLLVRAKLPDINLSEESISFSYMFDDLEIHRSTSNISKIGNDINVILTDVQPNSEISVYNVVGDKIYSQNIDDKNITISKVENGFKIITLKVDGEIVDYKRIY